MSDELKPCPFCGQKAYIDKDQCPDGDGFFVSARCNVCRAKARDSYFTRGNDCPETYAGVREAWNTRAAPRVKPLVWTERQTADGRAQWFSDFGHCVTVMDNNRFRVFRTGEEFDLRADAIEAAQGEHERDVRRALE